MPSVRRPQCSCSSATCSGSTRSRRAVTSTRRTTRTRSAPNAPMTDSLELPVSVVGLIGGECFGADARAAIEDAAVIVGSDRQLALTATPVTAERVVLDAALDAALDVVAHRRRSGARVCVLASGDPGF